MIRTALAALAIAGAISCARAEDAPAQPAQAAPELQALGQMLNECQSVRMSELAEMYRARAAAARKPAPPPAAPSEPAK